MSRRARIVRGRWSARWALAVIACAGGVGGVGDARAWAKPQAEVPPVAPETRPESLPDAPDAQAAEPPVAAEEPTAQPQPPEVVSAAPSLDPETLPPAIGEVDGESYVVQRFELLYRAPAPGQPAIEDLLLLPVELGLTRDGYVKPRAGVATVRVRLGDAFGGSGATFFASAIQAVGETVVRELQRRNLIGLFVVPDDADIDELTGRDRRRGRRTLRLVIWTGTVEQLRTVASGERMASEAEDSRIDHPMHLRLRNNSPVQPGDLLRRDLLDNYALKLNRHPGRRVDIAVAPTADPGTVALDFLVNESKPWTVYAQLSNTGTKQTGEWRERVGFVHSQLTSADDTLRLDYSTANFDSTHAFTTSYERPLGDDWKLRGYGSWNKYAAADVGFAGGRFLGEGYGLGVEIEKLVWQEREWFLDVFAGARFDYNEVDNQAVLITGDASTVSPYVGARLERLTDASTTRAVFTLETMVPELTGVSQNELNVLGRVSPDESWTLLKWDVQHSFYLEPLIDSDAFAGRGDGSSKWMTLAHEIVLSTRGQWTQARLTPSTQQVVGGLYSVRGYPESVSAGDTVLVGSAEYRFHLPRSLNPRDPGETPLFGSPFRVAPQQAYGRADWDLVFKTFFDAGRSINSGRRTFERDLTLMGAGVGVELQFLSNLSVQLDLGMALRDAEGSNPIEAGDTRLHVVVTVLY